MTFNELITFLSDPTNWKESPFEHNYWDKKKIDSNTPLNLYWLIARSKQTYKFANEAEFNILDYISEKLGDIEIFEEYQNEETISEYNVIFHFKDHENEKGGIYIKTLGWKDSHNTIFFRTWNWEQAKQVWPTDKEIFVFENVTK